MLICFTWLYKLSESHCFIGLLGFKTRAELRNEQKLRTLVFIHVIYESLRETLLDMQGLFEGLKAYRTEDDRILIFRPHENALRMQDGAERLCMASPSVEFFVEAVKQTVIANKKWVWTNNVTYGS